MKTHSILAVLAVLALSWFVAPFLQPTPAKAAVAASEIVQLQKVLSQYTNSEGTPGYTFTNQNRVGIYSYNFTNVAAYAVYVHFYSTTTAPTPGTTVPYFTVAVPATSTVTFNSNNGRAIYFSKNVGYSVTKAASDTDATHALSTDLIGFYTYR